MDFFEFVVEGNCGVKKIEYNNEDRYQYQDVPISKYG